MNSKTDGRFPLCMPVARPRYARLVYVYPTLRMRRWLRPNGLSQSIVSGHWQSVAILHESKRRLARMPFNETPELEAEVSRTGLTSRMNS